LRTGEFLGGTAYFILAKDRHKTIANLKKAFGNNWSERKISKTSFMVFKNTGKTFTEMITMQYRLPSIVRNIKTENFQIIDDVLKKKKGIIIIGGHFGNWELLAAYFALKYKALGYKGGVIGRRIRYYKYDQLLVNMRKSYWIETFYREQSVKPVLKLLRKNGIIGVVPDQDVDSVKNVFVKFFGNEASTPVGPAYLSLFSGAPLVPACLVWEKDSYVLKVDRPIIPGKDRSEEAMIRMTEAWAAGLENFIKAYPEQWVWFHDRWKTGRIKY
jgi:KDO2-lipid IV(A) lauroyltransferase